MQLVDAGGSGELLTGVVDSSPGSVPSKTLYPVIGLPPSDVGAVQLRMTAVSPGLAVRPVGTPGTVSGLVGVVDVTGSP
jgi:hypothetical protein